MVHLKLTYRIPYDVLEDYFLDTDLNRWTFSWTYKIISYIRNRSLWSHLFIIGSFFTGLLLALRIFAGGISWIIVQMVTYVTQQNTQLAYSIFDIGLNEILLVEVLLVFIGLLIILFVSLFRLSLPFFLRDLINDPRLLKINRGNRKKVIDINKFILLAIYRKIGDIRGVYKYLPAYTQRVSLAGAKKTLKQMQINEVPVLTDDEKYVPWAFEIIDPPDNLDKKWTSDTEASLALLWEYYLDIEFERFQRLKKRTKDKSKAHSEVRQ